jgi:hypothetical protein
LFQGTRTDNMQDCKHKGRNFIPRGELGSRAVLTESQVLEIRSIYRKGKNSPTNSVHLARRYGVAERTICGAATGASWKHLKP